MTDLLVRIPFSGDSDFSALALAPGLPMLDGRKLAYQVLLGWFGDLLAEPELEHDGVRFFAQSGGERQKLAEHALATQRDLDGHLAGDYERLRKALFDVRPVSPSERLIFNRLQPPIGNADGFLYRVRPVGSSDRLVWCWGFQRRHASSDLFLCPHADCSLLFVRQDTSSDSCPRCERPLFLSNPVARRTTFPTSAVAATVVLGGLVGATYWIASVSGEPAIDSLPALAAVSPPNLDEPDTASEPGAADTAGVADTAVSHPASDTHSGQFDQDTTKAAHGTTDREHASAQTPDYGNDPLRPFAASTEPRRLNLEPAGHPFDEPQRVDRLPPEEATASSDTRSSGTRTGTARGETTGADTSRSNALQSRSTAPQPALPEPAATGPASRNATRQDAAGKNAAREKTAQTNTVEELDPPPASVRRPSESTTAESATSGSATSGSAAGRPTAEPPVGTFRKQPASDAQTGTAPATEAPPGAAAPEGTPESTSEADGWSTDYVAAYQRAIAEHRYLVMLFREPSEASGDRVSLAGLPVPAEPDGQSEPVLVAVPTTMPVPGQPADSSARLIDHRSFRHLQQQAGIAVVDLTRTGSPNFGRVVSAFPGATDRRSIHTALQMAQALPAGTISQRTLLLAVRTSLPDSDIATAPVSPLLNRLASRNSRYMAHLNQTGVFETESRRQSVQAEYGADTRLRELVFATEDATTIQVAAAAAVEHWQTSGALADLTDHSLTACGLELFQSPATGRWFATLLLVTR